MKKCVLFASVAMLSLVCACNKEMTIVEPEMQQGREVTYEVSLEEPTRITFGELSGTKIPVYWSNGDAFRLFSCRTESDMQDSLNAGKTITGPLTDCGLFTTTADGTATAYFTGTIPVGALGDGKEGIAIFPASAYTSGSAKLNGGDTKNPTNLEKYQVSVQSSIPDKQDGSGIKYILATARLRNGIFQKFDFQTLLVKVNITNGESIDKVILSCQDNHYFGLAADACNMYYYLKGGTTESSNFSTKTPKTSIEVSRDGEVLPASVYFATRNLKLNTSTTTTDTTVLSLKFFKGNLMSKVYTWKLKSGYNNGQVLAFNIAPEFPALDSCYFDNTAGFEVIDTLSDGVKFPWNGNMQVNKKNVYRAYNVASIADSTGNSLPQSFFTSKERTYKFAKTGENWTFGSTLKNSTDINGKYVATSFGAKAIRMDGSGAYIKTPVKPGKRLVGAYVAVNTTNGGRVNKFRITSDAAGAKIIGRTDTVTVMKNIPATVFFPAETQKDSAYYIQGRGFQPTKVVLYYQ